MHKTDANHREIAKALRDAMCSVVDLSAVGGGCPDLLVARAGRAVLLEIKAGKNKLSPRQEEFHRLWRGPVAVVRTVDDALRAVGILA